EVPDHVADHEAHEDDPRDAHDGLLADGGSENGRGAMEPLGWTRRCKTLHRGDAHAPDSIRGERRARRRGRNALPSRPRFRPAAAVWYKRLSSLSKRGPRRAGPAVETPTTCPESIHQDYAARRSLQARPRGSVPARHEPRGRGPALQTLEVRLGCAGPGQAAG